MKIAFFIAIVLVAVSSVAVAQSATIFPAAETQEQVVPATKSCGCEVPTPKMKETPKKVVAKPKAAIKPVAAAVMPQLVWAEWMGWVVILLALTVAFLLGRATAPVAHQPQVVAPVVYVQPPAPPPLIHQP